MSPRAIQLDRPTPNARTKSHPTRRSRTTSCPDSPARHSFTATAGFFLSKSEPPRAYARGILGRIKIDPGGVDELFLASQDVEDILRTMLADRSFVERQGVELP